MAEDLLITGTTKEEKYQSLLPQIKGLLEGESDLVANMGNVCAALKFGMDFFWVGFYLVKEEQLVLGPFQGPVACTRIHKGKGVCGASWQRNEVIIVEDVEKFPGHIACSALSRSEIVLPLHDAQGSVTGVFDVDSSELASFDHTDEHYLKQILSLLSF
jgi:L-methionine (R)-S-oxide reductase